MSSALRRSFDLVPSLHCFRAVAQRSATDASYW